LGKENGTVDLSRYPQAVGGCCVHANETQNKRLTSDLNRRPRRDCNVHRIEVAAKQIESVAHAVIGAMAAPFRQGREYLCMLIAGGSHLFQLLRAFQRLIRRQPLTRTTYAII